MDVSEQAFENWKKLRALASEPPLREKYDAFPDALRKKLGPLIRNHLKALEQVSRYRELVSANADYRLSGDSTNAVDEDDIGLDRETDERINLPKLRDYIDARKLLIKATSTEPRTNIRNLCSYLSTVDDKVLEYLRNVIDEWDAERKQWEGKDGRLEKVQKLLESCENSRQRQARLRSKYSMGKSWVGSWSFSRKGAMGTPPGLWVRQDVGGSIIDRCVIKETEFEPMQWAKRANRWWYDPRNPTADEKTVHSEIAAMAAFLSSPDGGHIVAIRNWKMFEALRMYRLYLEFCPHGDLGQWTDWYRTLRKADLKKRNYLPEPKKPNEKLLSRQKFKDDLKKYMDDYSSYLKAMKGRKQDEITAEFHKIRDTLERSYLPEAFLWYTFERLATAGQLMEQPASDERWKFILHLDWKPANAFLGSPEDNHFTGYPAAKVGDFGLSKIVPRDDPLKPDEYPACGTPGCKPREQTRAMYPGESQRRRMDSKTNVWGVGIIIWSLMELENGDHRLQYDPLETEDGIKNDGDPSLLDEPDFRASSQKHYSSALRGLVLRCLRHEQKDRPTFDVVLKEIRHRFEDESLRRLRHAGENDPLWQEAEFRLDFKQDEFKGYLSEMARFPDEMNEFPPPPPPLVLDEEDAGFGDVDDEVVVERKRKRGKRGEEAAGEVEGGAEERSPKRKRSAEELGDVSPTKKRP